MNRWTRLGIEAYRAGNRKQAQRFFRIALMEKPDDIRTLLWMVEVASTDTEKERCLEQVLEIDPNQTLARQALLDAKTRLQSVQFPHVNPFSTDGNENLPPTPPAFIEVRSTPPFVEALAELNPHGDAPPPLPVLARVAPVIQKYWLWVGLVILVIVIIIFWITLVL